MPDLTLDDWLQVFGRIYGARNRRRTVEEMWLCAVQQISKTAEELRKTAFYQAYRELATTFAWFCGFYSKCRLTSSTRFSDVHTIDDSLPQLIALKYPDKCGHCGQEVCYCGLRRIESEAKQRKTPGYPTLFRDRESRNLTLRKAKAPAFEGRKLTAWIGMFRSIYGNSIYSLTPEAICFHLMEEMGETADALRLLAERARMLQGSSGARIRKLSLRLWRQKPRQVDDAIFEQGLMMWRPSGSIAEESEMAGFAQLKEMFDLNQKLTPLEKLQLVGLWRDQLELRYELADVFSWMCTLSIKLDDIVAGAADSSRPLEGKQTISRFPRILDEEYQDESGNCVCSVCRQRECREKLPA